MLKNIPVEKNKDYIIDITGMANEGGGVGKIDDFTVFIPQAIKGEKCKVKIVKVNKNFAFGKLLEVLQPSLNRVQPICPIYNRCGGCQIQHISYEGQLEFKRQKVKDVLSRIGKIDVNVESVIGMKNPYRYRNKVQLPVGKDEDNVKIGFYAQRSHQIIDINNCFIQDEIADKVIALTKEWMQKYNIEAYNEEKHKGIVKHIMIRKAFKTNQIMIVIIARNNELPYKKEFINIMVENIEGLVSVIQNVNSKKTNVIMGDKNITLWGKDTIVDYIGNFKFNISPLSFFQVNPIQTEILYNKALEYADLNGNEIVFDAYCGTGTISLFLSQKAKKVYGVEIIKEAIDNAKINAKENNVNNAEFIVGKSEEIIPKLIHKGIKADVVVVDPPRKGCEKSLLEEIANMKPKRIVYVSCDPSTLARDLAILKDLGYNTEKVQPVDMFSQTSHVECVVLMSRVEK
ncbi:23S rRNA (uracil(1939)-C(5))-methyltransferase RlmD [Clostridium tetanomorphum]|uniref:23S rRNA (Uracil(1939)-C(5))-methyltransferase RlmD n=1 Tax=Clostridium tetanomorphum TaxID=1553 RepID=A0A923IZN3_CLOTT|nr:23S rRNA (uracil(1939)-C(5))-methyltransferase RlmD [Clostridium tetanomorphum]MBC2397496.1 23S rRNA (uracil(1939)-C(5))-methyltransferase RlmD [Clostridium tetanomorphum]NRZ95753.1 23S rRNA (uracil1939-C5)-methyltransferase [Clostridium tetanomorphum]